MTADHAVFPVEPCPNIAEGYRCVGLADHYHAFRCEGCLGDGRRVLLDQGVSVEELHVAVDGAEVGRFWQEVV